MMAFLTKYTHSHRHNQHINCYHQILPPRGQTVLDWSSLVHSRSTVICHPIFWRTFFFVFREGNGDMSKEISSLAVGRVQSAAKTWTVQSWSRMGRHYRPLPPSSTIWVWSDDLASLCYQLSKSNMAASLVVRFEIQYNICKHALRWQHFPQSHTFPCQTK